MSSNAKKAGLYLLKKLSKIKGYQPTQVHAKIPKNQKWSREIFLRIRSADLMPQDKLYAGQIDVWITLCCYRALSKSISSTQEPKCVAFVGSMRAGLIPHQLYIVAMKWVAQGSHAAFYSLDEVGLGKPSKRV
ncbi:hypothetical protein OK016_11205 [Vibrio chagasii]|nr:hypothetical protein [Vibrio chagasii]